MLNVINIAGTIRATIVVIAAALIVSPVLFAQRAGIGTIKGAVADGDNEKPLEFVNVLLYTVADSAMVTGMVTEKTGKFNFSEVRAGEYVLKFSLIGYSSKTTASFLIDSLHKNLNTGTIKLDATTVDLDEVLVRGEQAIFNASIDRKVYNVGQDIMSKSGSASELLQNVPSVAVDIDGNVSLRGSGDVKFLLNGKTSPMLERNSATVLEQMPANAIERIEILTNPGAKYKPEGSSGIINIVLKKNTELGFNGAITGAAGNLGRYSTNLLFNYNPGEFNFYGRYSYRRNSRNRLSSTHREQTDSTSVSSFYNEDVSSDASPLSHSVSLGCDYDFDEENTGGISGEYFYNMYTITDYSLKSYQDASHIVTDEYVRRRLDDEFEKEYDVTMKFEHTFPQEEHVLNAEFAISGSSDGEENRFTNEYLVPPKSPEYDNVLIHDKETQRQATIEYANPLTEHSTIEAGYNGEFNSLALDYYGESYNASGLAFIRDTEKTNNFLYDEAIHALYATYKHSFGAFGFVGGLRAEEVFRTSTLVTLNSTIKDDYRGMYPSLHLSYKLDESAELQLSYSRRTRRPDGDELNPFPEYQDPRNISAGNPNLLPEYIHSIEFGCQLDYEDVSLLPSVYYRNTYDRFTSVTRAINDTVLLTRDENLSREQSGGVEVILSGTFGDVMTAHVSTNAYYNRIDASNLGYGENKSTVTWRSGMTCNINLTQSTRMQVNSNFNSARLTPQGEYAPSYTVNTGFHQELWEGKAFLIFTVSDLFKTQKRELRLDTPALRQTSITTRDSRIFSLGFTYHVGSQQKKREEEMKYEDGL